MNDKYTITWSRGTTTIYDNTTGKTLYNGVISLYNSSGTEIPTSVRTPEFVDWLINTELDMIRKKDLLYYLAKYVMTAEQLKKCYASLSLVDKANFIRLGYMNGLITGDIFNELLDACYKGIIDGSALRKALESVDKKLIDKKMILKILDYQENLISLEFVSKEYLDYDIYKRFVESNYHSISVVPIKYQTIELQKIALNQNYKAISSIPEEALSDEIIRYALNLSYNALRYIPENKITDEHCKIAWSKSLKAFDVIPDKYKSYDMCIKTLLEFPNFITKVPAHIINEQFLNEIKSLSIIIPTVAKGYVNECIRVNSKMDEPVNLEEIPQINPVQLPKELANITIDSLSPYFSPGSLDYLKKNYIRTFEQLCNMVNNQEILTDIKNDYIRSEITVTTKLLKCKYLNEDPLININDDECISRKTLEKFGFGTRAIRSFSNVCYNKTPKELLNMLGTEDFDDLFHKAHYIGEKTVNEIILKLSIIKDYYDSVEKNSAKENEVGNSDKNIDLADELETLLLEFQRLVEERERIDAQTAVVLSKIQEKTMIQSKGGVCK